MSFESCITSCPRQELHDKAAELIEAVRELATEHGQDMLDDDLARSAISTLAAIGFPQAEYMGLSDIREGASRILELLEAAEEFLETQRVEEKRFCIGALKMRAKDPFNEYTIAICRSPKPDVIPYPESVQSASITKKSL